MAVYPIKMLKDEGNNPFVPLVGTNAIVEIQETDKAPVVIDKTKPCNIISNKTMNSICTNKITHTIFIIILPHRRS